MGLFKKINFSFKASCYFVGLYFISISLYGQKQAFQEAFIFPSQGQHVHSSSIVELPNGDLLSCWFQGSGERTANDVVVNGSRLKKGSKTWSAPFVLADTPGQPDCNPVLFLDGKGKLYLFWVVVQANSWERSILKYKVS
ncbi:MAG TPA: exo-alpha-sialidase, partial [Arenibacter sp.]|nr:exo-alpha-sialidase [Arenibacter sp.]